MGGFGTFDNLCFLVIIRFLLTMNMKEAELKLLIDSLADVIGEKSAAGDYVLRLNGLIYNNQRQSNLAELRKKY